jgi:uncharacterized protein YgiM (DUF1202 family)
MKQIINWQAFAGATISMALAITAFPAFSTAASTTMPQDVQPSALRQKSLQNENEYEVAQASVNCRRVDTSTSNLNVRSSPAGGIIGSLPDRTLVTIENTGSNGWVPISSPRQGYVFGTYLTSCEQPFPPSQTATPLDNCREVAVRGTTRVREEPSINSPIKGVLTHLQRVNIVNRGENGWVPISNPISGYMSASALKYCS